MLKLALIKEPNSKESVFIQKTILNSNPFFNQVLVGKERLTAEDIIKENKQHLELGAKYFYINQNDKPIGLIHFLPKNPYDDHTWIGLLIIHKQYQKNGLGSHALSLLEKDLRKQNIEKVRLCVQHENDIGASFWSEEGFSKISTAKDHRHNHIDIYEKVLI
ncbi:GNAT family N-acetyltransferase [Bacillus spongiae]|uniref:GNAT family N-acetyltransferase n=1 Tax=Bacillus spongiae TaxID=2683610 RepID=A0ABU8HH89_9BACI